MYMLVRTLTNIYYLVTYCTAVSTLHHNVGRERKEASHTQVYICTCRWKPYITCSIMFGFNLKYTCLYMYMYDTEATKMPVI